MHAGALAFRADLPAEQLADSVQTIRQSAHQALADLRDVLGVLRAGSDDANDPDQESSTRIPVPTAGALPDLIASTRAAGMVITADLDEEMMSVLPDQVGRTAYRVAQEGLTNASRHAAGAAVHVTLRSEQAGEAEVSVRTGPGTDSKARQDRGTALPESGFGLTGLRERVAMLDGTLHAGPDADGYLLCARLPWTSGHGTDSDPDRR